MGWARQRACQAVPLGAGGRQAPAWAPGAGLASQRATALQHHCAGSRGLTPCGEARTWRRACYWRRRARLSPPGGACKQRCKVRRQVPGRLASCQPLTPPPARRAPHLRAHRRCGHVLAYTLQAAVQGTAKQAAVQQTQRPASQQDPPQRAVALPARLPPPHRPRHRPRSPPSSLSDTTGGTAAAARGFPRRKVLCCLRFCSLAGPAHLLVAVPPVPRLALCVAVGRAGRGAHAGFGCVAA